MAFTKKILSAGTAIPGKIVESAVSAWTAVLQSTNNQWRRDSASEPPAWAYNSPIPTSPAAASPPDVLRCNALERAVMEEQLEVADEIAKAAADKIAKEAAGKVAKEAAGKVDESAAGKVDESAAGKVDEPAAGKVDESAAGKVAGAEAGVAEHKDPAQRRARLKSNDEIDERSRYLIKRIEAADAPRPLIDVLEELSEHILLYPGNRLWLTNNGALPALLKIRIKTKDEKVLGLMRECFSLLGCVAPPRSTGVRILSIDGGGVRGLIVIEILRRLEIHAGKKISELFDYVVGVSTGALIIGVLFGRRENLDRCDDYYRTMSATIFQQSTWWGTGKLVWNHAYYDTSRWQDILKQLYGDVRLHHTSRYENAPKFGILSAIVSRQRLVPFLFRNYQLPPQAKSYYAGCCDPYIWEAVRASSSAPFYFEEFDFKGDVHQDGGIIQNNPTAAAIHEARLLWPDEKIHCVVSVGSGKFDPEEDERSTGSTNLRTKIMKIVDSATDTEAVHILCKDLLSSGTYFRLNPKLSEPIELDETRPEKLELLRMDAIKYTEKYNKNFVQAANRLIQPRTLAQKCRDFIRESI